MKRIAAMNQTLDEEISDSLSTSAPNSSHNYLEDPSLSSRNNVSETDSISDASRKIRKKRNAYQKISDEIRMDLLDSVRNGETLKSAAKRHKINYSSAKSILHTYRKEGRILKKSAQERSTTKKKASPVIDTENPKPTKASRQQKKATTTKTPLRQSLRTASQAHAEKGKIETDCNSQKEETPYIEASGSGYGSLYKIDGPKVEHVQAHQVGREEQEVSKKEEEVHNRGYAYEHSYTNFADNRYTDVNVDYMFGEAPPQMMNFMPMTGFGDLTATWYNRSRANDSYYNDPNAFLCMRGVDDKAETGMEYHGDNMEGYEAYPLREFMDAQNLLMRNSVTNYHENKTGMRKNSLDFF